MSSLFDLIEAEGGATVPNDTWRPEAPPHFDDRIKDIYFNFETDGLKWFDGHLPIALSIYAGDRSWYLPFKHAGGGNLTEDQVYDFVQHEFPGKNLHNTNTRFDIHMGRAWGDKMGRGGLDFEAMGCHVTDVSHSAALLDDHRFRMNLDSLITDYLQETPMVRIDETRMASYSAGAAQARSRYNVEAVKRLEDVMNPQLEEQGLMRVKRLEDNIIYVVCEMEKNGSPLNLELLDQWVKETHQKFVQCVLQLHKETGLKINPNSTKDQAKLFKHLHIPFSEFTEKGAPSFTDDIIKHIDHPSVKTLRRAKKYLSLNSKFRKYQRVVGSDGILRYALNQLRTTRSDLDDAGETGTITGRFTSTEIVEGVGTNIQQVMKLEKQFLTYGDEFFVRELHIPGSGEFLSADAEQIQYRLFAHEANNPNVIKAYQDDPSLSFHKMVWAMLKVYKPDLSYRRTKDINFAKIFAAGLVKIAYMMEFISKREFNELQGRKGMWNHPKLQKAVEILKLYKKVMPEADEQVQKASKIAEERGHIKTIMGRRMRFPDGQRLHKAFNGRIQGSEADIVKTTMVELHKNRRYTGFLLRYQVHDEVNGDAQLPETRARVEQILNTQYFPSLRVPIRWKATTGKSWGDCSREELAQLRAEHAA